MASVKFLIVAAVLVGCANAKFVWEPDNDDDFPAFKMQMPVPPTPPRQPFAPFAPFAPFVPFQPFAPFPPMQPFAPFPPSAFNVPMPHIISADEIRKAKPGQNGVYNGVMVSSSSNSYVDKDGKVVKKGGTSVLTNQDGKVKEWKHGNAPPDINKPIQFPKFRKMKKVKMPKFEPIVFEPIDIDPIEFEPIKFDPIPPIDIEDIKHHKPGKGETFSAYSVSSSSNKRTVNGKVVEDNAASSVVTNDNGKVKQQHAGYNKGDKH